MNDPLQEHLLACLRNGPCVALVDPAQVPGLPEVGQRVLLIRIDTEETRAALETARGPHFGWAYADPRGETTTAQVPWTALLGISGPYAKNQRLIAFRPRPELPRWLGSDAEGALRRAFEQIRQADPDPRQLPGWRFVFGVDGPRPTSKAAAAQDLVATGPVTAFIRTGVPGFLMDPAFNPNAVSLAAHLAPTTIKITPEGLEARLITPAGTATGYLRAPWAAVAGLQDPTTGRGWFWPADLPDEVAAGLPPELIAEREATLQSRTLDDVPPAADPPGHPLGPPVAAPFFELPAPRERDKRKALMLAQRRGGALLLIDPRASGARVPGHFAGLPFLVVPQALPAEVGFTNFKATGVYIQTDLPDFDGVPRRLTLTWNSIFAISNLGGAPALNAWPRDYPPEVREALSRWSNDPPPSPLGDEIELPPGLEPAWTIDTRDGYPTFAIRQPLGPVEGTSRPTLTLEVRLPTG